MREEDLIIKARTVGKESKIKRFPRHHEVRFAEHLLKLVEAVISNHEFMVLHWQSVKESGSRTEKSQAIGFLKTWESDSINWTLTLLLADILLQFRNLQKESQRTFITLPDLLSCRDRVLNDLKLMQVYPHFGGKEEQFGVNIGRLNEHEEQEGPPTKLHKSRHSLVTTS